MRIKILFAIAFTGAAFCCREKRDSPDLLKPENQARFLATVKERSRDILENIFASYDTCSNQFASMAPSHLDLCTHVDQLKGKEIGCFEYKLRSLSDNATDVYEVYLLRSQILLLGTSDTLEATLFYYMPMNAQDFFDRKEEGIPARVTVYKHDPQQPLYDASRCL